MGLPSGLSRRDLLKSAAAGGLSMLFAAPALAGLGLSNPEGAFLLLAFSTTSSVMAMNEANANGVASGHRSILTNDAASWRAIINENRFFPFAEPFPFSAAEPGVWMGKGKAALG